MNGRGEASGSRLNVLEALNSRYTCLYEPPPSGAGARRRYLTSLLVYGNREVEDELLVSNHILTGESRETALRRPPGKCASYLIS
ncbi:hypothetical protein Tco_0633788 [Tanacetum coccineum]